MLLHLHEYMSMTNIYQLNFAEWYIKTCNHVDDVHVSELSVRFEVGVSLLLAPARADKRGPMAPFPLVENAGIQPAICKRVSVGAPAGAGSYWKYWCTHSHTAVGYMTCIAWKNLRPKFEMKQTLLASNVFSSIVNLQITGYFD